MQEIRQQAIRQQVGFGKGECKAVSFLWKQELNFKNKKKPSPKGQKIYASVKRIPFYILPDKRTGPARKRAGWEMTGSMTLEAAVLLPMLLIFCINLSTAIEMIRLHGNMQMALWNTGRSLAVHGLLYKEKEVGMIEGMAFSQFYVKEKLIEQLGEEYLEESPIVSGKDGLNLLESQLVDEEGCLDITVTYRVALWSDWLGSVSFRMCNRYVGRAWSGYDTGLETEGDELVYISDYASVCHRKENCTHLRLDVREVDRSRLASLRNAGGSSYETCRLCGVKEIGSTVYVGRDGNRYHSIRTCSGLKRTVHAVRYSRVRGMKMCTRCGG